MFTKTVCFLSLSRKVLDIFNVRDNKKTVVSTSMFIKRSNTIPLCVVHFFFNMLHGRYFALSKQTRIQHMYSKKEYNERKSFLFQSSNPESDFDRRCNKVLIHAIVVDITRICLQKEKKQQGQTEKSLICLLKHVFIGFANFSTSLLQAMNTQIVHR